jgi:hypothetical protein
MNKKKVKSKTPGATSAPGTPGKDEAELQQVLEQFFRSKGHRSFHLSRLYPYHFLLLR